MINRYVYPDLVWVNKSFLNKEDLFKTVAQSLYSKNFVTEKYYESLMSREIRFPTGLDLEDYFVAIPHSDCENIKKEFISVVILEKPVAMNKMDDPQMEIPVEYVFFLGINNDQDHLKVLKEVITVIQNKNLILEMKKNSSPEKIVSLLSNIQLSQKMSDKTSVIKK